MANKLFCLVLHSHIPYVLAHGSWPHGMDWLYEASAESYLPLLRVCRRLRDEGIRPCVNISFTPVLMEQLNHPAFARGFRSYLDARIECVRQDRAYFERTGAALLASLASYWERWYEDLLRFFEDGCRGDILAAYRSLQDDGQVEVLTSAATHGYLPLLADDDSIRWQVRQGIHAYKKYFGRRPVGFWLPECAYRPGYAWRPPLGNREPVERAGLDEILKQEGIDCFFVDTHLLRGGEAKGVYNERFPALKGLWDKFKDAYHPVEVSVKSPYEAYLAHPSGVPFLVRDETSGSQVWSGKSGYPGDGWYLEFHKKHFPGGLRYWRVTSSGAGLGEKQPYEPAAAGARLAANASHFVDQLEESLSGRRQGAVVALYDTELFGHWWFEGPEWLYLVLKKLSHSGVRPQMVSGCLETLQPRQMVSLPEGSWGEGGFHWIWLNDDTSWIWDKIYRIEEEAAGLAGRPLPGKAPVLKQFVREKLLLESSDWPFLISTGSARDYAENRAAEHFDRAAALQNWLVRPEPLGPGEERLLEVWEQEDGIFSEVVIPDGNII
jgi:1,4-alpha-glucan branching enzyme